MKRMVLLLFAFNAVVHGQTAPPGTISAPPPTTSTNRLNTPDTGLIAGAGAGAMFTNSAGAAFSVTQLNSQLQNLRSAVDQLLPTLAAFNETSSNSIAREHPSTGGAVSEFLKGLSRGSSQGTASSSGSSTNKIIAGLENLLGGNSASQNGSNPRTTSDLMALQKDLQPVVSTLEDLHVNGAIPANTAPAENRLTPTGR